MKPYSQTSMLKDKYIFNIDYANAAILSAHVKALQQYAVVKPHERPKGKSLELLVCAVLKKFAKRLDGKLFDYATSVRFQMTTQEILAFHCAYKADLLPRTAAGQTIFETIDKVV